MRGLAEETGDRRSVQIADESGKALLPMETMEARRLAGVGAKENKGGQGRRGAPLFPCDIKGAAQRRGLVWLVSAEVDGGGQAAGVDKGIRRAEANCIVTNNAAAVLEDLEQQRGFADPGSSGKRNGRGAPGKDDGGGVEDKIAAAPEPGGEGCGDEHTGQVFRCGCWVRMDGKVRCEGIETIAADALHGEGEGAIRAKVVRRGRADGFGVRAEVDSEVGLV